MQFAGNLKRTVYVASQSVNANGVQVYAEPKAYRVNCLNVLPTSASAELETFGTSVDSNYQIVGDPGYLAEIKRLDRLYIDTVPPSEYDPLAQGADYVVDAPPTVTPNVKRIALKRLTVD